jgi:hypothetical protein
MTTNIKVYFPCGKSVDVKYRKRVAEFKKQIEEYKTHIVKIFITGQEDEPAELPENIEHVFCLLQNPRYLKVGFVATDKRENGDSHVRTITKIINPNAWMYRIIFDTCIISSSGYIISILGKASLSTNKLHSVFLTMSSLKPEDFIEPL